MPDDIIALPSLKCAYIIFPSVEASDGLLDYLAGEIKLNGKYYPIAFTPNLSESKQESSMPGVPQSNQSNFPTNIIKYQNSEIIVHEDWICENVNRI